MLSLPCVIIPFNLSEISIHFLLWKQMQGAFVFSKLTENTTS